MIPPDGPDEGETTRTVEVVTGVAPYSGVVKKERGKIANIKKRKRGRKALIGGPPVPRIIEGRVARRIVALVSKKADEEGENWVSPDCY
jgi:hypothetical protein